jgi:hypothetical protein
MKLNIKVLIVNFLLVSSSFCGNGRSKTKGLLAQAAASSGYGTSEERRISFKNGLDHSVAVFGVEVEPDGIVCGMIRDNQITVKNTSGRNIELTNTLIVGVDSVTLVRDGAKFSYLLTK